jgi:hypothetical protein
MLFQKFTHGLPHPAGRCCLTRSLSVIASAIPRAFVSDTLSAMTRPMSSAVSCFRSNSGPFPAAASCFSRCAICCVCSTRRRFIYIGEVAFKGEVLQGGQEAILNRNLFEAVQAKLDEQSNNHERTRTRSEALLTGRIFDDVGNRMSPTHARKAGVKYRYYLSSVLLNGAAERAGSVARVPAAEVEAVVVKSVREHVRSQREIDDRILIETHVVRVDVHTDHLIIKLAQAEAENDDIRPETVLSVPWQKMASTRRREILIAEGTSPQRVRRIRSENRATLVASIARARRWLTELITDPTANPERIAKREQCSVRKVNLTLSLAFLVPDLARPQSTARSHTAWALFASPICRPNGPGSGESLASGRRTNATSNRVSVEPISVSRETGISAQRQTAEKRALDRSALSQRPIAEKKAGQLRAFVVCSGNLRERATAWWGWEGFRNLTNSTTYRVPPLLNVTLISKAYFRDCPTGLGSPSGYARNKGALYSGV